MTVLELSQKLSLEPVTLADGDRQCCGAYIGDLLSWVMGRAPADSVWITIMSNVNIVAVASLTDVSCIVLAEGVMPDEGVRTVAEQKGVNILSSEKSAYELAAALAGILK